VSGRSQQETIRPGGGRAAGGGPRPWLDPAQELARVACAKRETLLRVHCHRLRREDLEDCYSQATLELVASAQRGRGYSSRAHMGAAIEQRFVSRIHDRRRALGGRSPMQAALENAQPLGVEGEETADPIDPRANTERIVFAREDLALLALASRELTRDQRLVLACQLSAQMTRGEFCERFGWSAEKYRKVAQRARARLRHLMAAEEREDRREERGNR
jgi:DNA-directed RNA polymerase specialized sigma24 family protein